MTENVHYAEQPNSVIINRVGNTYKCRIDFPIGVEEEENGFIAGKVYSLNTTWTKNISQRVERNYDAWLRRAMNE